ncbi:DUF6102 family protein [Acetobacterium wieringae]|uniref:DUF6102 family protein n=1 Tax=Acetobacterium wieringae TaxID=52694 RepID=A0ABY6HIQ4_9FIRM|nr:conjugal transfer protein TrbL family protein [Acetobacterium wieringae]UYO64409.1 DUF6102 family protein [Acetobacterium wieringae]VUZ25215.1 Uncharacterised protein [Acetobacterium wieringae]
MFDIFSKFIEEMIKNSGITFEFALSKLIEMVFYMENYIGDNIGVALFTNIKSIMYGLAIWLLILKFSKKGFETYILGTEGDPDSDPYTYLLRFVQALVLMLCFPILYDLLARITLGVGTAILGNMSGTGSQIDVGSNPLAITEAFGDSLISNIISAVGLVLLYFQILMRGAEMFVMRIGFYLACVGYVESDKGAFAPYMMTFLKCALTTLVQVSLLQLSLVVLTAGSFMIGWAFMFLAIGTPKFLQQFMVPTSGGGSVMGKVYQGVRLADVAMRLGK